MTLASNLLRKATARLAELSQGIVSIELTIVDEFDTGADVGTSMRGIRCIARRTSWH